MWIEKILDAIHFQWEDEPEVEWACYAYLKEHSNRLIAAHARRRIKRMHRCMKCGRLLVDYCVRTGNGGYWAEYACPHCDLGVD